MLSASRRQPHLLQVSAVDRRQTWSMDKSWRCVTSTSIRRCFSSSIPHWLLINIFLHYSPYLVVHSTKVRTVGRPQVWFDKIWGLVYFSFAEAQQFHAQGVLACPAVKCKNWWQCDGWLAATVWTARHHDNMSYSLSSLAPQNKPNQCTRSCRQTETIMLLLNVGRLRSRWSASMCFLVVICAYTWSFCRLTGDATQPWTVFHQ